MKKALVISKTEKTLETLEELLRPDGYTVFEKAISEQKAKELTQNSKFDLVVIDTPLSDSAGLDLSVYMIENTRAGVFILIGGETFNKVGDKLRSKGVVTLPKPMSRQIFHQSLRVWECSKTRIDGLEKENHELKLRVEEIKIIDRAKCVLMQCLAMSEPQAHRYLEKQAMDLRQSKMKVAEQVLNTYEI